MDEYLAVGPLDSLQTIYSMVDRDSEADLLPKALENKMAVLAYSPLAMGMLSGKLGPEREFAPGDVRSWSPRFTVENREKSCGDVGETRSHRRKLQSDGCSARHRLDAGTPLPDARSLRGPQRATGRRKCGLRRGRTRFENDCSNRYDFGTE